MKTVRRSKTLAERFWAKVDKNGAVQSHCAALGPCWIWTASTNRGGYGLLQVGDSRETARSGLASRVSWELLNGPVPHGMNVLHKCDNPPCVNPGHLFLGSIADNNRDAKAKGRVPAGAEHWSTRAPGKVPRGERHYAAKITAEIARGIREMRKAGAPSKEVQAKFGVNRSMVKDIANNKSWKDV